MTPQLGNRGELIGNAFRAVREMLEVSQLEYSQWLEIDIDTILLVESGQLPPQLDDQLLKLLLAAVALRADYSFIPLLLAEAADYYHRPEILEHPYPLLQLFEPVMLDKFDQFPWVAERAFFRCRLLQLTDQANGILIWAEQPDIHRALIAALPANAGAQVSLIDRMTLLFVPSVYLFLKFDTSAPDNPVPELLYNRFTEGLPIGLTLPYEPFSRRSPDDSEVAACERRLFIFSLEGTICEILGR